MEDGGWRTYLQRELVSLSSELSKPWSKGPVLRLRGDFWVDFNVNFWLFCVVRGRSGHVMQILDILQ